MHVPRRLAPAVVLLLGACDGAVEGHDPLVEAADVAQGAEHTRNVVIFLVDTLRADHLGAYGYARDTSPRLDALAAEGIVFEDCIAQSSWTKPATASILTGEYPARHGATNPHATLAPDVSTLAEHASEMGVATGAFLANGWINKKMGFARGFDTFQRHVNERCDVLIDEALKWVEAQEDDPFLLFVHVLDPHDPYEPPAPFDRLFADPAYDGPVNGHEAGAALQSLEGKDLEHLIALYDGEIAYTDQEFGRFLDGLRALGRYEDTAILFLADHGEEFNESGAWRHNPQLHPEVIRIPLVLSVPGVPSLRGLRHAGLVRQIDVMPTVLQLLGGQPIAGLPGRSLLSRLLPSPEESRDVEYTFVEVDFHRMNRRAVFGGGMKYVREYAPANAEYLFDLRSDPEERQNLLPRGKAVAERYASMLDGFLKATNSGFSLLVQNGSEEAIHVSCFIASPDAPMQRARIFNGEFEEDQPWDGPVEHSTPMVGDRAFHVTRVQLFVKPNDSDGIVFEPPENAGVIVCVKVDDHWASAERFLLGPSLPAREVPIRFPASTSLLDAPAFPAKEKLAGEPYRIRLWRNLSVRTDDGEISDETLEALRAIGYLGEE